MRKAQMTLLRIFFVLVVVLGAIQLTGAAASASCDFCLINYTLDMSNCGTVESCQPGDDWCAMRNAQAQACQDAAETKYARCIGWID